MKSAKISTIVWGPSRAGSLTPPRRRCDEKREDAWRERPNSGRGDWREDYVTLSSERKILLQLSTRSTPHGGGMTCTPKTLQHNTDESNGKMGINDRSYEGVDQWMAQSEEDEPKEAGRELEEVAELHAPSVHRWTEHLCRSRKEPVLAEGNAGGDDIHHREPNVESGGYAAGTPNH